MTKTRLSSHLSDDRCCGDDRNWVGTHGLGRALKPLSDLMSELQRSVRDGKIVFFAVEYLTAVSLWVFISFFYNGDGSVGIRFNIRLLV